jgi:hypothetical protein
LIDLRLRPEPFDSTRGLEPAERLRSRALPIRDSRQSFRVYFLFSQWRVSRSLEVKEAIFRRGKAEESPAQDSNGSIRF